MGRKSWLFCGSDRGGVRAAAMYTLIGTAKLNNVDPQAWLADVLDKIAGTPQTGSTNSFRGTGKTTGGTIRLHKPGPPPCAPSRRSSTARTQPKIPRGLRRMVTVNVS